MKDLSPILEVRGLRLRRGGVLQLDIPSLTINPWEILALIGPNGAGKTTLMQALARLIHPIEGRLLFEGEEIDSYGAALKYRRRLAMVFQEPLLFDTTVFENVGAGLRIRGLRQKEFEGKVRENLERFGIDHLRDRSAKTLSGGEAQRTSLARALATDPGILFLDEPFASLDPPTREALMGDLEEILRKTRTTTILATHDRMEALRLSDRMGVIMDGRILQIGPSRDVMNHPVSEFVASFVGVETILTGEVVAHNGGSFIASVAGREIEAIGDSYPGESVVFCIRPENVTLSTHMAREETSARNIFPGRITRISSLGFYQKVQLDCGFPLVAYVTNHSMGTLSLREGKEIVASFKATAIHVIRRKGEN
jgi:tungstate transport system ATP-binding protein